jgi:hypothetical protein
MTVAGLRHGVKIPQPSAGASVEGATIAGRTEGLPAWIRPYHNHVFEDGRDRVVPHGHVHFAFLAEARVDFSRVGVESD